MAAPVTLLMAIHCHQPVGNFGFVFEDAFAKAYDPFLEMLERHPHVRLALHYSGSLLDWLHAHRPAFLSRVRRLAARGQVELLASGYYEPILPLIPEADRQGQLMMMRAALRRHFGADPHGAWLTERVWEPNLPETLSRAGLRYTMLDTNQFETAKPWLPGALQVQDEQGWDVLGCYATDYAGATTILFPASKRLRYWLPFQPVERTVEFLKRLRREEPVAITFADDGEKFGLWPKTHEWVYQQGWLQRFFAALERERAWLTTATFQSYLEQAAPAGRVSLPTGSYEEMLEWSGGQFRNFFTKYPEANAMQQKMLGVSQQISALRAQGSGLRAMAHSPEPTAQSRRRRATQREAVLREAERELYAGQCNCAYWHGVFGGLYLGHLRRAVYQHLLAAEALAHRLSGAAPGLTVGDVDGDGRPEARLATRAMTLVVDPAEGGAITEWSLYEAGINLLDTVTRRPEPYHEKLRMNASHAAAGRNPASIHELVGVKERNLADHLVYDDHRRSGFLDYGLQRLPTLQDAVRATWGETRLWSGGEFQIEAPAAKRQGRGAAPMTLAMTRELLGGRIRKTVRVEAATPAVECAYALQDLRVPVVAVEWNLGVRDARYLTHAAEHPSVTRWTLQEPQAGVSLTLSLDPPATLLLFPIETVSESEEGLERTYQGLSLMCVWTLDRAAASSWASRMRWTVG